MKFQLESPYQPTGDQPQAIDGLLTGLKSGAKHNTLMGVTGSGKTFTLANTIQALQMPTLVISHNKTLAAQLYQEFRDFFPHNAVNYFVSYYDYYQPESYLPATDPYIEKETDINDEIDKLRLATTANLLTRPDCIVVASVSCIYNLGSPVEYGRNVIELIAGELIDRQVLITRLIDIQYQRSDYDLKRGTFRLKGDTLQVWPSNYDHALTLQLLDNQIISINPIDPVTGEILKTTSTANYAPKTPRYTLYPAKHYQGVSATPDLREVIKQIQTDLKLQLLNLKKLGKPLEAYRLGERVKHDIEMIQEMGYVNGIENYSRYFDRRQPGEPPFTLIDYFHYTVNQFSLPGFLTIIDESHITLPQLRGMYRGDQARKQTLIDYGFRLPSALDNRPLTFDEILPRLPQIIYSSATPDDWELDQSKGHITEQIIRPTGLVDPEVEIRPLKNQVNDCIQEIIKRQAKNQRVIVTTLTKKTAEALTEYIQEKYPTIKVNYLHADVETLDRSDILDNLRKGDFDVVVGINLLREGLDLPEVSLVAILDADSEGFLRSKTSLIQTMGRAARHQEGQVILYADRKTGSMTAAIDEVTRRRQIQLEYNRRHQLTPESINKPIRSKLLDRDLIKINQSPKDQSLLNLNPETLTPLDKNQLIKNLRHQMNQAAKRWDFEAAANYRDMIHKLSQGYD